LVAVAIYLVIGTVLGVIAGNLGGPVDGVIMRIADVVLSFPSLMLIIVIVSVIGPSIYNVMLVIGLLGWPAVCRLVRGNALSLRERDFVTAARAAGVGTTRTAFRHILPNTLGEIIVAGTFGVAAAILTEAGLSFLGLGVQPPMASWGNMLIDAQSLTILESMPWLWLPPGLMIALSVLSINFVGDGLRDALDPRRLG
jgi:peptide/nickel transport system permease protein